MTPTCPVCRFFVAGTATLDLAVDSNALADGACHRYPRPLGKMAEDWCGEWAISEDAEWESKSPDIARTHFGVEMQARHKCYFELKVDGSMVDRRCSCGRREPVALRG